MPTCYRHPERETGLSCNECGRPVCTDCATFAPVGIRCPDHSGKATGVGRVAAPVRRIAYDPSRALVTKALIAVNVVFYLVQVSQSNTSGGGGWLWEHGVLFGPLVDAGDWWRLISSAFLHYTVLHIAFNMLALWWFGRALEAALGPLRFTLIYFVSALAGSAGALIDQPLAPTVGASGAIFGIFGAAFVLERYHHYVFGGAALTLILLNLVISFTIPNIALGGHIGGLVGGAASMFVLYNMRRRAMVAYALVVGIGALSVAIAYWQVRGLAP
jgi:membrane associated rhomboid family serine protease